MPAGPSIAEQRAERANRRATKGTTMKSSDEEYRGGEDHSEDDDASGELEEEDVLARHSPSASPPRRRPARGARGRNTAIQSDEESEVPFRTLRARNRINYALPPPIEDLPKKSRFGVLGGGRGGGGTPGAGPSRLGGMNSGFMADINLGMGLVGDPTAGYGHLPDSDSVSGDASSCTPYISQIAPFHRTTMYPRVQGRREDRLVWLWPVERVKLQLQDLS